MKRILMIGLLSLAACGSSLDLNVHGLPDGTPTDGQASDGNQPASNGNQQVVNPNNPSSSDGNFQVVDPNTGVVQGNPNATDSNTVANANDVASDGNTLDDPNVDCMSGSAAGLKFNQAFLVPNPGKSFVDSEGLYDYRYGNFTVGPVTQPNDPNLVCYRSLKAGVMSALAYNGCHGTWSMSGFPATYENGTVTYTGYNNVSMVLNDDGTGSATLADGTQCTLKIAP